MMSSNVYLTSGADTIHPAPGADGAERPSFTALVCSINVGATKFIAREAVQQGRVEIIQDLKAMAIVSLLSYTSQSMHAHKIHSLH